jgi:hypothetical protein
LNTDFGINNEKKDCKVGTVWAVFAGGGGGMEERKVKEYVDGFHIHTGKRMKPFVISLSGREKRWEGRWKGRSNQCTM